MGRLTDKIIKGGGGVWGEVAMPAHPTLSTADARQMVTWIMSLDNKATAKKSLPASGTVIPAADQKPNSVLVISASYTDKGGNNIKALTGNSSASLRSNTVTFSGNEKREGFGTYKLNGATILLFPTGQGWFALDSLDLTGVRSATITAMWQNAGTSGIDYEVRLDAPDGKLLGKATMPTPKKGDVMGQAKVPLEALADGKLHTVYITCKLQPGYTGAVRSVQFNPK